MELRMPEGGGEEVQQLQELAGDPETDTGVTHRALAWAHVQKGEAEKAFEELSTALDMSPSDPWVRFGMAEASYHSGEKGAKVQGLANTIHSLQLVINEFPDLAEAYALLGWARLVGGGTNSAIEAMTTAIQLSPRNESYQLRLAETYLATKKWDEATAVLERLKVSQSPQIASAAKKELNDMPFLKKFGVRPEDEKGPRESITANTQKREEVEDEDTEAKPAPTVEPPVDRRAVQFLRAKLVSVDCSQAPAAGGALAGGGTAFKLGAEGYKSLAVVGGAGFSFDWEGIV